MNVIRRALLLAPLATPALAQGQFPERPIRLVIGYPPGGGVDTVGRPIMQRLSERLGQPVVVENRAGANGNIAMEYMARAEADGYTLFMGDNGNLGITHALYPNLPFDTQRDFTGVARLTAGPFVLVVPANLPARTQAEFVAMLKARPGALNFGSAGIGSGPHLAYESWRRAAGVEMTHVPYRGTGPALQGLLAGDVQLMIGNYGVFRGAVEGGRARVLAISSPTRQPSIPDVPTAKEAGVEWGLMGFNGVLAPARIPPARRQLLEDAFRAVMTQPGTVAQMLTLGSIADFGTGAELDDRMRRERADWTRLVREANIQAE
ncbi:tripartite tricarboxylate transporter substrate binding protein [Roseococcus sp. SYP-B2431]|uniref:Bug family tripartite tricarboxylate transporter substrate binding protein n=1 Tax=Roseococcus sp. SYP-B2431 TaxID=2496640 RepID=UPI001038C294|nr:tripartite tricarboxylate transporter substrate binding protein [Roseococcus sp. SYP-B2431]TCH96177.1 tripartite tricarboxylate transporter substrate binding protein [Roseococcus sp. SYP-B2431]